MKSVILRPAKGVGYLKVIIAVADLMFLLLPVLVASTHVGGVIVAVMAVFSLVCIVAATFLGWLGLDMRVEVAADAVRIYYFVPKPGIIPREMITDVQITFLPRGGYHVPRLVLADGRSRILGPLTVRTKEQAEEQAAKLRLALSEVAPAG